MTRPIEHTQQSDKTKRQIHFNEPPRIGFVLDYFGHTIELIGVIRRKRKNGSLGWLLIWERSDGVIAASGLSSNALSYPHWLPQIAGTEK